MINKKIVFAGVMGAILSYSNMASAAITSKTYVDNANTLDEKVSNRKETTLTGTETLADTTYPTSGSVATYVEGKGYATSSDITAATT